MSTKFSHSFKIQAIEKALNRRSDESVNQIATRLGIGYSTLQKWLAKSRAQELNPIEVRHTMTKEKRPQDWSLEEKLDIIIACSGLNEEQISQLCREKGLYPHHITQWKNDFIQGPKSSSYLLHQSENKQLKHDLKLLQKDLNRKDKALAETAALLVLKKKAEAIWGSSGDNSE